MIRVIVFIHVLHAIQRRFGIRAHNVASGGVHCPSQKVGQHKGSNVQCAVSFTAQSVQTGLEEKSCFLTGCPHAFPASLARGSNNSTQCLVTVTSSVFLMDICLYVTVDALTWEG